MGEDYNPKHQININDEIQDKLIQLVNAFKNLRQLNLHPQTELDGLEGEMLKELANQQKHEVEDIIYSKHQEMTT